MATTLLQPKAEESETYTYSSQPKPIQQRKKYRSTYGNIMYDKRIVRGNTYALHTLPASVQPNPLELQRQQEAKRRLVAQKRAKELIRIRSPEPSSSRWRDLFLNIYAHIDVQTELYLEEITDRVEEADRQTQTDAFLDRPATPLFVPAKTGMDASTQIMEGDLFDFDLEVKPIVEVLVGKTVEQALIEVMEEEELANLRAQQRTFEENRNAELVETQRLEEQERRYREEKERRMQQQREALLKEKETAEKIAAKAFAQSYLSDLVPSVFSNLNEQGFFFDPVERQIDTSIVPWMLEAAEEVLCKKTVSRFVLDAIIRDVVAQKVSTSAQNVPAVNKVPSKPIQTASSMPPTQTQTLPEVKPSKSGIIEGEEPQGQQTIPPIKLEETQPIKQGESQPLAPASEQKQQQRDQSHEEERDPNMDDTTATRDETRDEDTTLGDDLPEDTNAEDSATEDAP
ncbi:hypothetical protein EMCRGX_G034761 [Ephydatia muelleri]